MSIQFGIGVHFIVETEFSRKRWLRRDQERGWHGRRLDTNADTEGDLIGCLGARHQLTQPRGSGSRTCNPNGNTLDVNQHLRHNYRQVGCDESVCRLGVLALVDTGGASTTYTNSPFDHTAPPDLMTATRSQFTRREDDSIGPHSYRA